MKGSNSYLTPTSLQHRGRTISVNLLYDVWFWSYGASKFPNFRIFAYFSNTNYDDDYDDDDGDENA